MLFTFVSGSGWQQNKHYPVDRPEEKDHAQNSRLLRRLTHQGKPFVNQFHRHLDNNRPLILPPHAVPFFALICLIFAAASDITNAVNKADGMGQWAVYFIRCLWSIHKRHNGPTYIANYELSCNSESRESIGPTLLSNLDMSLTAVTNHINDLQLYLTILDPYSRQFSSQYNYKIVNY